MRQVTTNGVNKDDRIIQLFKDSMNLIIHRVHTKSYNRSFYLALVTLVFIFRYTLASEEFPRRKCCLQ